MTVPRWIPLLAAALFVTVGIAVALLWNGGLLRAAREDVRGGGAPTACDPPGRGAGPPPADCPQSAPPTARAP